MNRSKKLYVLLGILAVACIATFAVMQMEERKEQIKETGEIILELPSESVQSLSWEYNEETLAFHKDETWLYDEDENFPVSEKKINELLEQFQAFAAAFIIEDVEDFGQYGLDDPICTINMSTEEQSYEVKLGDYSKMDSQRYVSIGDGNVYLVKHDPLDDFDISLNQMIKNDEIPSLDLVTEIQFSGSENYKIVYEENSSDSYSGDDVYFVRQGGKNQPLDSSKVDSYLWLIRSMSLNNYVSYNASDEELAEYGLDDPDLSVSVVYTSENEEGDEEAGTLVVHISRDAETKAAMAETAEVEDEEAEISAGYVRINDSRIIYQVSADRYEELMATAYNDLRHTGIFWADFADVRQIDVALDGAQYAFTSEEDGDERIWSYQGKELEIADFQYALAALAAEEFSGEHPSQKQEITLILSLDNENVSEVQIELYRYDGEHCLAVVDGESISLVERSAVVDLIEAVHAIVLD